MYSRVISTGMLDSLYMLKVEQLLQKTIIPAYHLFVSCL